MKTKNQNTIELEKDLISLIRIYDPILYTRFNNLENKQREIIFRYLLTQFHQNVSVYFDERIDKSHFSFYQRIYNGKIKMTIPPMTNSGQKFRISNKGLKTNGKFGDMIITVEIQLPKNMSEDEINIYGKLKKMSNTNIREQ